jgi:SAM-dependent methyltransferase
MHFFEEVYQGSPPWEIGAPQPAIVRLEEGGEIVGRVLDVGCGTGENAYYLAGRGHPTWGIDFAPTAIAKARAKRSAYPGHVTFRVGSALDLASLGERFDTVVDSGLFHTFLDPHRPQYAAGLGSVLRPGGNVFVLCFSEHEPTDWGGPRRVTQAEIRETFRAGWEVRWIREERFATRFPNVTGRAWLAGLRRTADVPGRSTSEE